MRLLHGMAAAGAPVPGADLSLTELQALYAVGPSLERDRVVVRANMVMSLDGSTATDGVSEGLSGSADKDVFAVLRSLSDVVLVGAGTARTENYRPARVRPELAARRADRGQSPVPRIAIVSRSLRLDTDTELMRDSGTVVITSKSSDSSIRHALSHSVEVIVAGDDDLDPSAALAALADRGLQHVLCEGGPTLLGMLAAADVLDELCMTISPQLTGEAGSGLLGSVRVPSQRLSLHHVLTSDDFLFTRYLVQRREADRGSA